MADLKDRIDGAKLRELYLPGTHDAAAYERYAGLSSDNLNTKYAITQASSQMCWVIIFFKKGISLLLSLSICENK